MSKRKFQKGDRVHWDGNHDNDSDTGVVVEYDFEYDWKVWVKWDSDGQVLFIKESAITLIDRKPEPEVMTEETAVMFLLSLGYTITKDPK